MKKIIIVFFLTLFIPITKVDAVRCQYAELSRLKKIASNINSSYDYVINGGDAIFNITLVNLHEDIYLFDPITEKKYEYTKNEITIKGYASGTTVQYEVYASDPLCGKEVLSRIRVVLPKYNIFYQDKVCQGAENYSLCQKWSGHDLTYSTFAQKVTTYKENLTGDAEGGIVGIEHEKSIITIIIDFLLENYLIVLILVIGVTGTYMYINKRNNIYS